MKTFDSKGRGSLRFLLSGVTILTGMVWIIGCLQMYASGGYRADRILSFLMGTGWIFGIWLALLILALIFCPKPPSSSLSPNALDRLDMALMRREKTDFMLMEEKKRCRLRLCFRLFCLLLAFLSGMGLYLRSRSGGLSSTDAPELILRWFVLLFPLELVASILLEAMIHRSILRELDLSRNAPQKQSLQTQPSHSRIIPGILLAGISLLLMILGIENGGLKDVLKKAVLICSECIGLG